MACLFGHKWNGCKCVRCGKLRDEGHDWNGCTCRICGRKRDEGHDWQRPHPNKCYERCSICGKERRTEHEWDGCKCIKCGKFRDEGHDWNGCICRICGKKRSEGHDWQPEPDQCLLRCTICGMERGMKHDWQPVDGKCEMKCSRCGAVKMGEHQWEKGFCKVCGEKYIDAECIQLISILQSDKSWEKRRDAAGELAKHPCDESRDALISGMKTDGEWVVRFCCAEALGVLGDKKAVIPLTEALLDESNTVVEYAAKALGELKDERSIEPMIDVMRRFCGGDYTGVSGVCVGLGRMGDIAVPRLLELVDTDIREHVLRALAKTGSPLAMELLVKAASDENDSGYFRSLMADGIGHIGGEKAIIELKDLLSSTSEQAFVKAILRNLKNLGVSEDALGNTAQNAERASAQKLLDGLGALHKGMREDEADRLIGGAQFGMGANQVHQTSFGSFQLLVSNGIVYDMLFVQGVIEKIEKYLNENEA